MFRSNGQSPDSCGVNPEKKILGYFLAQPLTVKVTFNTQSLVTGAEWLACWTQAQMGLGSNRSRDAVE